MKKLVLVFTVFSLFACKNETANDPVKPDETSSDSLIDIDAITETISPDETINFTLEEANKLAELPLACVGTQYPNKLSQTLDNAEAIGEPKELHPAFYGCFDWHSSVHGHWSMVALLKKFPNLEKADEIRQKLEQSLSAENIKAEVAYFKRPQENSYERTYGWAWLLKLAEELKTWNDPLAKKLDENLQPLTDLIVSRYLEFLPKLKYPIRVGEHTNTAFGLGFAYDYAVTTEHVELKELISKRAKDFYLKDDDCPISWEPGGYDFLSPCLEEVDIMRRIMPKNAFFLWIDDFMPALTNRDFSIEVGEVSDRSDGKLVHLDGLNFSRAWVFYGLANDYPEQFGHLRSLADSHLAYSFPNLVGDSYEGGHWLGTFAIYALSQDKR
tara:strand:- start:2479 stop:3633 length:1155 start_codon:yes stop_codon:yes gene_type:complete